MVKTTGEAALSKQLLRFVRDPLRKRRRVGLYQKSQVSATADGKTSPAVGYLREQNLITLLDDGGFRIIKEGTRSKRLSIKPKIPIQRDVRLRLDGPSRDTQKTTTNIEIKHLMLKGGNYHFHNRVRVTGACGIAAVRRKQGEMLELAKENKVPAFLLTIFHAGDATMTTKFFPVSGVNRAINKLRGRAFAEIKNEASNNWGFLMSKQFWELAAETPHAWSVVQSECDLSVDACENTWKFRSMRDENFALLEAFDKIEKDTRPRPNTRLHLKTQYGDASITRKQVEVVFKDLKKRFK